MSETPEAPGAREPLAERPTQPPEPPMHDAPPAVAEPSSVATPAPVGQVRETGVCFLLMIVTLGFYSFYWYFKNRKDLLDHLLFAGGAVVGRHSSIPNSAAASQNQESFIQSGNADQEAPGSSPRTGKRRKPVMPRLS